MSYDICVLDPAFAGDKAAASEAWDQGTYYDDDASLPDSDRSARKWKIKDALLAFNPALTFNEPKAPATGILSSLFEKKKTERTYLTVNLLSAGLDTSFDIFDQAIEISLPWDAERENVEPIVRDLWRHLQQMPQLGLGTLYDTERDVLLNLGTDFDAVLQGYIKNLEFDDDDDGEAAASTPMAPQTHKANVSQPPANKPPSADAPFAGNVEDSKPWWKLW